MNWYKTAQNKFLEDLFGEDYSPESRKVVKKSDPYFETMTLTLYRGFDADLNTLKKVGNNYVLSPAKSEQGVLWFSQRIEIAKGRGQYILEYQLEGVKQHLQKIYYADGKVTETTPQEAYDQNCPTENCKFWRGYELPDGWLFSYKTQKYIICSKEIYVSPDMIKREEDYELV